MEPNLRVGLHRSLSFRRKKRTAWAALLVGGRCYCLQAAEHETAFKVVIIDEQITCKSLVIEIHL